MEKTADSYSLAADLASFYALALISIKWRWLVMDEQETPKRRGRPRLPDNERKRHTMTFRMRSDLRERFAQRAAENGCSISEEIEKSLEREVASSDLNAKQSELISTLNASLERHSRQLDIYEKQIFLYKDMVSGFNKFAEDVKSVNYYMMKRMLEANLNVLKDMKEGKDLTSQFGSIKQVEDFISELREFLDSNQEPKPTDTVLKLQNSS